VCVCVSVQIVYCGKMADWIWMPFGMLTGVSQGIGVLDLDVSGNRPRGMGSFGAYFVA